MRKLLIAATMLAGFSSIAFAGSDHDPRHQSQTCTNCAAGPSTGVGIQQGNTANGGAGGSSTASQTGLINQTPTLNQSGSQVGNSANTNNVTGTNTNRNANTNTSANTNVSSNANRNQNTSANTNTSSNRVSNGSASTSRGGAAYSGGSYNGGTSVGNSGNTEYRAAANAVALPSVGGGGFDCPVVGIGLGGSAVTGSGTGIASWISTKCNDRKVAELMILTGHPGAALSFLGQDDDRITKALKAESDAAVVKPVAFVPSAWCAKASKIERDNNPGSCGPRI